MVDFKETKETIMQKATLIKNGASCIEDLQAIEAGKIPTGLSEDEFEHIKMGIQDTKSNYVEFEKKPKSTAAILDYVRQIEIMDERIELPSSITSFLMLKESPEACTDEEYDGLVEAVKTMHMKCAPVLTQPICSQFFTQIADENKTYKITPEIDDNKLLAISSACYKLLRDKNPSAADPYAVAVLMSTNNSILHYEALGAAGKMKVQEVFDKVKEVSYKAMCLFNRVAAPVLAYVSCISFLTLLPSSPVVLTIANIFVMWKFQELSNCIEQIGHFVENAVSVVGGKLIEFANGIWNKLFHRETVKDIDNDVNDISVESVGEIMEDESEDEFEDEFEADISENDVTAFA